MERNERTKQPAQPGGQGAGREAAAQRRWRRAMAVGKRLGCHQRPERSFVFHGRQFPLCARCTGVWIGYVLGLAALTLWRPPFWLSCAFVAAMLLDWTVQRVGWRESTNARRLVTGVLGGFGVLTGGLTAALFLAETFLLPAGL